MIFLSYLFKRFHIVPLALLVASDIFVVYILTSESDVALWHYVLLFLMVIAYLLANRVNDDLRDFEFDRTHYPERDVQQGEITKKTLRIVGWGCAIFFVMAAFFIDAHWGWGSLGVVGFAWWAKHDFFLPESYSQRHFFTYNFINMLQMLVLQIGLYTLILKKLDFSETVWWHIGLVFTLSLVIEVTRKIKPEKLTSNDQYSDRLGFHGGLWLWLFFCFTCMFFISGMLWNMEVSVAYATVILTVQLTFALLGLVLYRTNRSSKGEKFFWLMAILFYIAPNFLLGYV